MNQIKYDPETREITMDLDTLRDLYDSTRAPRNDSERELQREINDVLTQGYGER